MSKKKKFGKKTPQPSYHWLLDSDGCWDCNCNHNGCKRLKEQRAYERDKRRRKEKMDLRKLDF